jgi:type I restriction enzyme R subunit
MEIQSANFRFLHQHDPQLVKLAALAEQFFHSDSNTCIIKLRQYAERLAKIIAANTGLYQSSDEAQAELLKRLKLEGIISSEVADLFHAIRIAGNKAVHNSRNADCREALTLLKNARQLGIWFHRTFKDRNFKAGAFVPPVAPIDATAELQAEIARLQAIALDSQSAAERSRLEIAQKESALMSAEAKARQAEAEKQLWEQMAIETEQKLAQQITNQRVTPQQTADILQRSLVAAQNIDLDEDQTRQIIDQKLRDRGWEVDSQNLRYSQGVRPSKGKNIAIAEYPTRDGIADYALFIGLRCVAMIEAKRRRKNVAGAIAQAERYARGYNPEVPFVFATNGRGYLKQLETASGIWFRDRRKSTNHSRALVDFYTPEGLEALLAMDRETAHEKLKNTSFNFGFDLYPHQRAAIEKIEAALEKDRRSMLVAMATGTGKTKLANFLPAVSFPQVLGWLLFTYPTTHD